MEDDTPARQSAMWHLCWQAAIGRNFFADPSLYGRVRNRLIDAHDRRGRVLVDFTLLPTEIHVMSEISAGDSTGSVARAVGNVVSRWVRETSPVRSPVMAGRYRARCIESAAEQKELARMLAWRAVFHGLCSTPAHHPHGAYRVALGMVPGEGFNAAPLLRVFGLSVPQQRIELRRFVQRRPTEQERLAWELRCGLALAASESSAGQYVNAREMRSPAAAALVAAGGNGVDGALDILSTWVAAKVDLPNARGSLQAANDAAGARGRGLVGCLALELQLCSAANVARYFKRSKATLSEQMAARRTRTADKQIVGTPIARIIEEAAALASARAPSSPTAPAAQPSIALPNPAAPPQD